MPNRILPQEASSMLTAKKILYVDDESVARAVVKAMLRSTQINVLEAVSVDEGMEVLKAQKMGSFDCVITDYNMPQKTGLELLRWCKAEDPTLSTILLTAVGDRDVIKRALSQGAVEFLDKPLSQNDLFMAVEKATILTKRMRELFLKENEVQKVEQTQSLLLGIDELTKEDDLKVFYLPRHEAGGDLIDYIEISPEQKILLIADISGHDLRAAYVSAYFKGVVRGMLEAGSQIPTILQYVNEYLLNSWNQPNLAGEKNRPFTSISVQVVEVLPYDEKMIIYSAGSPPALWQHTSGYVEMIGYESSPLGWDQDGDFEGRELNSRGGVLYLWTDGIDDLADTYHGDSLQIFMSAVNAYKSNIGDKWRSLMGKAEDDLMGVQWNLGNWGDTEEPELQLFFNDRYYPRNRKDVDFLGEFWRKLLEQRFPDIASEKLFDVILLLREVVLNGISHGCKDARHHCELYLYEMGDGDGIRIFFRDPGAGYEDNFLVSEDLGSLDERNAGLMLIKSISEKIEVRKKGAELLLDISLNANIV